MNESEVNKRLESIDKYAKSIQELGDLQEKLYGELLLELQDTNEHYLDLVFDYCYNGGPYTKKVLQNYILKEFVNE